MILSPIIQSLIVRIHVRDTLTIKYNFQFSLLFYVDQPRVKKLVNRDDRQGYSVCHMKVMSHESARYSSIGRWMTEQQDYLHVFMTCIFLQLVMLILFCTSYLSKFWSILFPMFVHFLLSNLKRKHIVHCLAYSSLENPPKFLWVRGHKRISLCWRLELFIDSFNAQLNTLGPFTLHLVQLR